MRFNTLNFKTQMDNIKKTVKELTGENPEDILGPDYANDYADYDKAMKDGECWSVDNHLKTCKNHFRDDTKLIKEVDSLLNWGIKNGFLDEDCKDWSWDKKLEFYRRCP